MAITGDGASASLLGGEANAQSTAQREWLKRTLGHRLDRNLIEDLVQEAYLRLGQYEPDVVRNPRALLLRIAHNLAKSEYRRLRTARRYAESLAIGGYGQSAAGADQLDALILKETIAALPPPLRDVFVLHRFHGLTYREIAASCNLAEKTVEWRMSKALALCAAHLRE